jgi:voltage-gated potassium channel
MKLLIKNIYDLVEGNNRKSKIINGFIAVLIVLNIIAVVLDSYKSINNKYFFEFYYFEVFSICIFSIEYIIRVIVSPYKYSDDYEIQYIWKYIVSPLAIIDLFSILPFYLPLLFRIDLRMIRIVRVFRLIRILKIKRYSKSLNIIVRVLRKKKTDLALTVFIIGILLLLSGSIIYYVENELQPDIFPNIIESSIWALKTMVFLGYDTPPLSIVGKIMGLFITMLGLGWIALPISIISSGFIEEIQRNKKCEDIICPYCGKSIKDH